MKQKTITIEIHGGVVHVQRQSRGTTLIVRDFDTDQYDVERPTKRNKSGEFVERKYTSKP